MSYYIVFLSDSSDFIVRRNIFDIRAHSDLNELRKILDKVYIGTSLPHSYMLCDGEGFFVGRIQEYTSFDKVMENISYFEQAESAGNYEAYVAFDEAIGGSYEAFVDAYQGAYASKQEYAREFVASQGVLNSMPENLRFCFDYKAFASTLFQYGHIFHHGQVFRL